MARIFLALNCCLLLFAILCSFSEVVQCRQVSRRRDVHRIILKEKNRNRPKKHARLPPYHNEFSHENSFNPFYDQIGDYTGHRFRYQNRPPPSEPHYYETPHNYQQNFENYHNPQADFNFRPHANDAEITANHHQHHHHVMDIEEFNKNQEDLRDTYTGQFPGGYERYKQLMEHYNKKNEEQFRIKVEKQQNPYAEENLSAMATRDFPIAWQPQNSETFKGNWNPVSTLGIPSETKYADLKLKDFPHQNIEDIVAITTSKPFKPPSTIAETNLTKHRATNFDLMGSSAVYHSNHKYPKPGEVRPTKYRSKNFKNGTYQVHEENADSGGVSPILGSFQNLAPAASTSSYSVARKPEKLAGPNQSTFGLKTNSRRTKRPAK